jgi:5-deoxy-glucuronate isomerase
LANPFGDGHVLVAIAEAPASGRDGVARAPVLIRPANVEVEIRGAGNATRRIHHIIKPEFPADRLEVVEVYTPGGNWSSWPPHKHDVDDMPAEAVLEEIYYYQQRRARDGWGLQRLYRRDGDRRDGCWAVRHGELVLVTDGYHPFVAAHGYDVYYLNALAGDRRTMACTDDPDLAWTRAAWAEMQPDPRAMAMVAD